MKRFYYLLFLLLAISTAAAQPPKKEVSLVTTVDVVAKTVQQVVPLSGTTQALRDSGLSPRIDGLVAKLLVDEGDWVEKGQTLLALDDAIAKTRVASAQARVEEAQVRYADATRQKKEFESLRSQQHVAANTLASAIAEENAAKAAVAAQRADLQRLQELLSRHQLKAPFAGLIAAKQTEVGQWVKADSQVLTLVDIDTIRVRAPLPQRYFQQLDKASDVRVNFAALSDKNFTGKLSGIVSVGNQSTRSFPVFIDLDNPQRQIAPGMSAQVFVTLKGDTTQALHVPRDAIILRADGSRLVWRVVEEDEKRKVEPVKLLMGRAQGDWIEVLESTLKAGDKVVMLGNENLRPGQAIRINQNNEE